MGRADARPCVRAWPGLASGPGGHQAAVVILGVIATVAFDAVFETFHELFFPAGSFDFDPSSKLIQLFPDQFWFETSLLLGLVILAVCGAGCRRGPAGSGRRGPPATARGGTTQPAAAARRSDPLAARRGRPRPGPCRDRRAAPAETVPIEAALGRVAAAEVRATTDLPPWDNSAMDGYAVRGADIAAAARSQPGRAHGRRRGGGRRARRTADPGRDGDPDRDRRAAAGRRGHGGPGRADHAARRPTAARSGPAAARRSARFPAGVPIHEAVPVGAVDPPAGERPGRGHRRPARRQRASDRPRSGSWPARAWAASRSIAGPSSWPSWRPATRSGRRARPSRPAASPMPTDRACGPWPRRPGRTCVDLGIARDRLDDVIERLRRGVAQADVVIVSGGVSVGPYDVVRAAFEAVGQIELWRVAVQPGKPFAFGTARRRGRRPGPPVRTAGQPGLELRDLRAVRPAGAPPAGRLPDLLRPSEPGVLVEPVTKSRGRRAYLRVEIEHQSERRTGSRSRGPSARPPGGRPVERRGRAATS